MQLSKETSLFNKDSIKDDIQTAGQGATSYITKITNDGIFVHQTDSGRNGDTPTQSTAYGVHISDDVDIIRGGEVVASYGSEAQIGKKNTRHVEVKDGGMQVYGDSTNIIAHIGWGSGVNPSGGLSDAGFLTVGGRVSGSSIGNYSSAIGTGITASGFNSHAEGMETQATESFAHAEGRGSKARGTASHAEGLSCESNGDYSHASGYGTIANGTAQTVVGKYNTADTTNLFIVGKGASNAQRSNALEVDSSGNIVASGSITSAGAKVPTRNQICYANSRVDNFSGGQVTLALSDLGITTGAKPVGILLTYQDGGSSPTILRYDYDASSASGVVIKAYDSSGAAVSGNIRYFAVVFQNSWTSVT